MNVEKCSMYLAVSIASTYARSAFCFISKFLFQNQEPVFSISHPAHSLTWKKRGQTRGTDHLLRPSSNAYGQFLIS
ncbi:hypothetical protein P167DRAFT_393187 [Morchella conica CCBAS932]|uniref:Uncharacterized protein n=1 Tax=Morchella conica CCBAS932 TaxID=1392247 RepID=A0A3N4KB96_9PEZI|nr:hypothetical protein P167DRAFT_393187 [Morchella conica CCBAS932]